MRQPLIAGNWKMNGSRESVRSLLKGIKSSYQNLKSVELAVFPPYVYLPEVATHLKKTSIHWGAQNVSAEDNGAFTGEISANMLRDFQCRYVLIGHSERRQLFHENNDTVALKFAKALNSDLHPILCVGETLEARENNKTLTIIEAQLASALALADNLTHLRHAVVAYEPIWAIGTGKNASPDQAQAVHLAIREQLNRYHSSLGDEMRILYGGSVKPHNAADLFKMPDIDGALVGGASLDPQSFLEIARQCNNLS